LAFLSSFGRYLVDLADIVGGGNAL